MNTYETCATVEDQGQFRLAGVPFAPGTEAELVRAAIDLHQRFQVSYWDAAILAAAKQIGCRAI